MAVDLSNQINEARQNGYSDDEIVGYLTSRPELSSKIKEAQSHGYGASDIINHLAKSSHPNTPGPWASGYGAPPPTHGFWSTLGGDIGSLPHMGATVAHALSPITS